MALLGGTELNSALQRMKETGKIDGLVGADNVGAIIDHWNEQVVKKNEKQFEKDISARNKYYWKLWKRAAEDVRSGRKSVKKINIKKTFY